MTGGKQAIAAVIGSIAAFGAVDAYANTAAHLEGPLGETLATALSRIPEHGLSADPLPLAVGAAVACMPWLAWARYLIRAGSYRNGEEHGSSRWGSIKEGKAFSDIREPRNNVILTKDFFMALTREKFDQAVDRNHNYMVIGGPGSGKTRYYVKPNLMQMNCSYFVTDPKGTLLGELGWMFEGAGYRIITFDTTDFQRSMHYNPLEYVDGQARILTFVECLIKNTTGDNQHSGDPFWENAERLLYTALISYLMEHCRPQDRNLNGLMTLLALAEAREDNEGYMSPLDMLFHELETGRRYVKSVQAASDAKERSFADSSEWRWVSVSHPVDPEEDFALSNYKAFKVAAGKTLKSIIISCNVRLKPLSIKEVSELLSYDEMGLGTIGAKGDKTVIFASMSDTDSTYDFLFALLMWQSMDVLYRRALDDYGGRLPVPVHFVMDEFANIGRVPDFEKMIATARSRNVMISVILQSVSQLEKAYEREGAKTIMDCCDTTLFLGGKSTETNEMVSKMVGKQTVKVQSVNDSHGANPSVTRNYNVIERDLMTPDEVGRMPRDQAIVLISGTYPLKGPKYDITRHPSYPQVDPGHKGAVHENRFDFSRYRERCERERERQG